MPEREELDGGLEHKKVAYLRIAGVHAQNISFMGPSVVKQFTDEPGPNLCPFDELKIASPAAVAGAAVWKLGSDVDIWHTRLW
jgi:hypothetical protein